MEDLWAVGSGVRMEEKVAVRMGSFGERSSAPEVEDGIYPGVRVPGSGSS